MHILGRRKPLGTNSKPLIKSGLLGSDTVIILLSFGSFCLLINKLLIFMYYDCISFKLSHHWNNQIFSGVEVMKKDSKLSPTTVSFFLISDVTQSHSLSGGKFPTFHHYKHTFSTIMFLSEALSVQTCDSQRLLRTFSSILWSVRVIESCPLMLWRWFSLG